MTVCPALVSDGAATLADALANVDCRTGETASAVFGRLFGPNGHLLAALTIILTIYVALFAIGLLTGRSRIGLAAFTPRMMTLGLVLTFATSWVAYQNVVWTLASSAPDEIATVISGSEGSATVAFAERLDTLFSAVAESADQASKPAPPTETGITPATPMVGGFTASTVLWLSALMLLLGSVGVLVTAKIALAALLALGPVFIVFALFEGTRGLFEGWLKAVVMFAVTPLFAVLISGGAIAALEPIATGLALSGAEPSSRAVGTLFVGSVVFVTLMVMALKTGTTIVTGWHLPGSRAIERSRGGTTFSAIAAPGAAIAASSALAGGGSSITDERIRGIVASVPSRSDPVEIAGATSIQRHVRAADSSVAVPLQQAANRNDPRAGDVGRRFRPTRDSSAWEKIS